MPEGPSRSDYSRPYNAGGLISPPGFTHGCAHNIWAGRRDCNADLLCSGGPQSLVHSPIRWSVCAGISLWLSARRLALRSHRSHLGGCRGTPLANQDPYRDSGLVQSLRIWREKLESTRASCCGFVCTVCKFYSVSSYS